MYKMPILFYLIAYVSITIVYIGLLVHVSRMNYIICYITFFSFSSTGKTTKLAIMELKANTTKNPTAAPTARAAKSVAASLI